MGIACLRVLTLITIIAITKIHTIQGNQPPVWVESSVGPLKDGIREDTPIGTSLATLKCTDADGDNIIYSKTKGTGVSVTSLGIVKLAVELDFEDEDSIGYDLGFSCTDIGANGFPVNNPVVYELEMTVDDANDIAPEFSVSSDDGYTFYVSEDSLPNLVLQPNIGIVDGDRGLNAELSKFYLICNSDNVTELALLPETSIATCQKFRLSQKQLNEGVYEASLILNGALDYETRPVYSSKLIAMDNPSDKSMRLSTTINIQIKVSDAQDVDPLFVNLGASTIVSEGAKKGDIVQNMVIQARDGDYGDKRPVKIVMVNDEKNAFTMTDTRLFDADSGIYEAGLIVNNALDRESIVGPYYFDVKVIELDKTTGQETDATANARYSIRVSDIDDEPPQFERDVYPVNVTEIEATTETVQITGLRILCTDKDEPQNAKYNVRIVQQTFKDVFSISPGVSFTGTAIMFLTVDNAQYLDYDRPAFRQQTVVLEAMSTGSPPLSSSTTVSITLTDINDNRPVFEQQSYTFRVSESIEKLPYFISTIKADDGDTGENGRVTYRLEGGTSNRFEINNRTGALSLVARVDFEQTPLYVFLVYAEDHGRDGQVSQVQVSVEVLNANDQYPRFESPFYSASVNEDSRTFLTPINVKAFDNEEGTGTITYEIIKGQTPDQAFNLNQISGSLTLRRELSYDAVNNGLYELTILASDNGVPPLNATIDVKIQVIDQNNFAPVIKPKIISDVTISELVRPGTKVATIKGFDRDQGEFGKITYRISSGSFDNFVIDSTTGEVTVNDPNNLDYDKKSFYIIRVIASDGGAPQLSDNATFNVFVTDANNKKPSFDKSIYIETVSEDEPVNHIILTVFATDPDSNKDLFYSIKEGSIFARNGAGNLLTSTLNYNFREALDVDGESGDVYIKNKLDKELALEITFTVQVEDRNSENGEQVDFTQVSVTVTGEANTDLSFDPVQQIFVSEGSPKGYEITTVVARDPTTQNAITNYIQMDPVSEFFEVVQRTGQIRILKEIDYEKDPRTHRIRVRALADDNIRSTTATVTIKINDDNDNAPKFERTVYNTQVDEDAPPLTRVASIFASDEDTSSYGPIKYSIAGGLDADNFELYEATRGVDVLVARGVTLDYNRRDYYELDIVAIDNPSKQFSNNQQFSLVKLKIQVIDKNNHRPKFLEEDDKIRRMAVAETAPRGTSIGTVVATDDDFGVNGQVFYDLRAVAGDDDSVRALTLFNIVEAAGIITVARDQLVGFGGNVYKLIVFAQDGGDPFLSNTRQIEIEVLSTENNDGNPIWHEPSNNHIFFAPEETPGHTVSERGIVAILNASPRTGNSIVYTLSNRSLNAESFKVDAKKGTITVLDSLDREIKESYTLLIYAEDVLDPLMIRTGRQIIIRLTDKDDNKPTFTNPKNYPICGEPIDRPLEYSFYEEVPENKVIFQLSACDPDENKDIFYFRYDGIDECRRHNDDADAYLRLDKNGEIVSRRVIDYEDRRTFTMCAIAQETDVGRKKRAIDSSQLPDNVAYIILHVKDINDNGPKFPESQRSAVMVTDARDLPIIVMDAVDRDGKGFNVPVYSIIDTKFYPSGTVTPTYPGKAFVMKNNELHPDPPRGHTFQEFAKGRFVLTIQAQDPVNSDFKDTQEVTVYIHDKGQAMKVILNMPPDEGVLLGKDIVNDLDTTSGNHAFRYLHVSVHENRDGINRKKTDVCFIAVDENSHVILNTFQLVSVMARREYQNVLDIDSYKIADVGKCYPSTSSEEQMKWKDLWWVLVVLAIFLGFCAICFIIIIFFMHRRYRRYMESEKTYLVPQ